MSLLRKLFGHKSGVERLSLGERLLAEGQPGDARLELEAAINAADLPDIERPRAERLLAQARDELARERMHVADALAEEGDIREARQALELAGELASDPALRAQVTQRARGLFTAPPPEAEVEGFEEEVCDSLACASHDEPQVPEGEELDPLELALLSYPEQEADELATLAASEPAVRKAVVALNQGQARLALEHWSTLSQTVARGSLVRRERARAALLAEEAGQAAAALEEILPQRGEDPDTLELLMEARLALGDRRGAANAARQALERDLARDLTAVVGVLVEADEPAEALAAVDRALERDGKRSAALWELRGLLCQRLGRSEEALEAHKRALERFQAQCSSCGGGSAQLPLASARQLAEHYAGSPQDTTLERFLDLLRLLVAHDAEHAGHWRSLLRGLGG